MQKLSCALEMMTKHGLTLGPDSTINWRHLIDLPYFSTFGNYSSNGDGMASGGKQRGTTVLKLARVISIIGTMITATSGLIVALKLFLRDRRELWRRITEFI